MPRLVVIHNAFTTFFSFFMVLKNQLAPSAALVSSSTRPVTTGASAAEIHCDTCHADGAKVWDNCALIPIFAKHINTIVAKNLFIF